jgi:hypothetical protein
MQVCRTDDPALVAMGTARAVACHLHAGPGTAGVAPATISG